MREARKAKRQVRESDESESEEELEPGAVVLHKLFARKVVQYPDNTVVKSRKRIVLGEAEALKVATQARVPVPRVHAVDATRDGTGYIRMDYVHGETLEDTWSSMSAEERRDVARQLRGNRPNDELRETRQYFTYHAPPCRDEDMFNEFLLSSLHEITPPLVRAAFPGRLRTYHRIVLTHCDLTPRNIIIQDGKIKGLIDWEDGGWYPEYWEYVKFFQRPAVKGWKDYAEHISPEFYHEELVDVLAMTKWQQS